VIKVSIFSEPSMAEWLKFLTLDHSSPNAFVLKILKQSDTSEALIATKVRQ
jgi:hypothetical protein